VVDGADHLDHRLALMDGLLGAVLCHDGQLALSEYPEIHHLVVVPPQRAAGGEHILQAHQLGTPTKIVGQLHTVPALRGMEELRDLHLF